MKILDSPLFYLAITAILVSIALYYGAWLIAFTVAMFGLVFVMAFCIITAIGWLLLLKAMTKRG